MDIADFLSYLESHPSTRNLGSTLNDIVGEQRALAAARRLRGRRKAS